MDPEQAVQSVLRWHFNGFVAGATLRQFANASAWLAVNPLEGGNPGTRWNEVTGTAWADHRDGRYALDWSSIRTVLALNASSADFLYVNNVRSLGMKHWNIQDSEGITTDTQRPVVFDGDYPTWVMTARDGNGVKLFDYYYAYRPDVNIEVWVWDNADDPVNQWRYIFVREYANCGGTWECPLPEHANGEVAGDTLSSPALIMEPPDLDTIYVDGSHMGCQDGTPECPFTTVRQGHDAATDGDRIIVRSGEYHEGPTLRLFKAVRVEAEGGLVRIRP